jgi:hypothetical protein
MDGEAAVMMMKGETKTITATLQPPGTTGTAPAGLQPTLTATMCYIDAPGATVDGSLANQLTMSVEAGTPATVRYGNTGDVPDTANNVQKVIWENIPQAPAEVKIIVKCNVLTWGILGNRALPLQGGQDFALAWFVEWLAPTKEQDPEEEEHVV